MICRSNDDLERRLAEASGFVKAYVGIVNNASWLVCLQAHDQIKKHRNYRHEVKKAYQQAVSEYHAYESRLIYAKVNRFFHVPDLAPETRKRFRPDVSDREYYDFWVSIGAQAYEKTLPLVTSLWNKYRVSLIGHNIQQPDIMAWALTGTAALSMADKTFEAMLTTLLEDYQLPKELSRQVFTDFSMRKVHDAWKKACLMTDPASSDYKLNSTEERNIIMGLDQLKDAWLDSHLLSQSVIETVSDYDEIFRSKDTHKKVLQNVSEDD